METSGEVATEMGSGIAPGSVVDISDIEVIAPNFKKRLSGVTSTIVQLIPVQRAKGQKIAVLGPGLPSHLPHIRYADLPALWSPPSGRRARVWHARRNIEMLPGLFMRDVLRMPLKLLFTSAAQRTHSAWTRFLISKMDAVVATSARSGSYLKVPYKVVHHGVDLDLFRPSGPSDPSSPADGFGKHLIGCFGRVRHQKGTDLFVRALIELLPSYPEWTGVVCGRVTPDNKVFGDALKADVAMSGLTDRILFMGEVDDIKPWYRRLSLYVAPSRNEGFGLTPLEAMASGTAVVASDAGAYSEMIVEGETGSVVPAGDYTALREALRTYFENPALAGQQGWSGREHVRVAFAIEKEANSLAEIYETLLETRP